MKTKTKDKTGQASICEACQACDGTRCAALQKDAKAFLKESLPEEISQNYPGMRFTADAMDCAMPIAIDSHSGCSFACLYCFSNSFVRDPSRNTGIMKEAVDKHGLYRQTSLRALERLFARDADNEYARAVYPLLDMGQPIQWGALGEPFDKLEELTGWGLKFAKILRKYNVPTRVSTKGAECLLKPKYLKAFRGSDRFWFNFSFISANDKLLTRVDLGAPDATTRYKAMKALHKDGHRVGIRFRPFIPGVSDQWPGEPKGWAVHLEKCREAGCESISFEFIFFERGANARQRAQYQLIARAARDPNLVRDYIEDSLSFGTCIRRNRAWKYDMTMAIREKCHELGMAFCVSDPHFKEFGDTECCCGFPDDDPIWGKTDRHNCCSQVVRARKRYEKGERPVLLTFDEVCPDWARVVKAGTMINFSCAANHRRRRDQTWGDTLRNKWNNPNHARAPYYYFEGILRPHHVDENKDIVYEYVPYDNRKDIKSRLV